MARPFAADEHLAGLHRRPDREPAHRVPKLDDRPQGPQHIVLVRRGKTEHDDRLLAEKLLHGSPVAEDDLLQRRKPAGHDAACGLDVELLVDEELDDAYRDDLAHEVLRALDSRLRRRAGHEARVVLQDPTLQGAELFTGLHPGLLDDREPRLLVCGQSVLPAVGAVQREHLQPAEALVRRVLADEGIELADRLSMEAELELGLEEHLLRVDALFLEVPDRVLREAPVGEVGERRPAPEPERLAEFRRSLARRHRARLAYELLEAARVDLVRRDAEPVSGGARLERVCAEQLPDPRDAVLDVCRRRRLRRPLPQLVDEHVERDDVVRVKKKDGDESALLRAAQGHGRAVDPGLEWAQHAQLECRVRHERRPPYARISRRTRHG